MIDYLQKTSVKFSERDALDELVHGKVFNTMSQKACLTESGFMDCKESLEFLLSDEEKSAIVQLHVEGIEAYVQSCAED